MSELVEKNKTYDKSYRYPWEKMRVYTLALAVARGRNKADSAAQGVAQQVGGHKAPDTQGDRAGLRGAVQEEASAGAGERMNWYALYQYYTLMVVYCHDHKFERIMLFWRYAGGNFNEYPL